MIDLYAYYLINKDINIYYKYYIFSLARSSNGNLCWKKEDCSDDLPGIAIYLPNLKDRQTLESPWFSYKNFEESDLLFEADPVN